MPRTPPLLRSLALLLTTMTTLSGAVPGQDGSTSDKVAPAELVDDQLAISGRYDRFERLLSQMADILGHDDPERAELLRRAVSKGREQQIGQQITQIADALGQGSYGSASEKQERAIESLTVLLKLLQSEDRRSAVEKERERVNEILKNVRNTIAQQRSARGRTQNATAPSNAAPDQDKALDSNEDTLKDIHEHDARQARENAENGGAENSESESQSDQENGSESQDGESKPNEGEQESSDGSKPEDGDEDSNPSDSNRQSQNSQQSEQQSQGQQSQGQQSQGQQSQGQQSQGQQSQQQPTPGREQLEQASELMRQALQQLQQQEREKAVDQQDRALEQLHKAIEELEEQLRQLREEEKEMVLAALEARFQRMLAIQTLILEGTIDLAATPEELWLDNLFSRARELSQQQNELVVDCSQTAGLLREDGTSVSILLAVEDIEIDMLSAANRLQESKVGELTQTLQSDVIEALKELIEATQREMQEMKAQERQQAQQQSSQEKPPLVELIAEIRVLRSLQLRVNRRTKQVDRLRQTAVADDVADLNDQLIELSERQQRLKESAGELADQVEQAQRRRR